MLNPESYFNDMERVWRYLQKIGDSEKALSFLCEQRGYEIEEVRSTFKDAGMIWIDKDVVDMTLLQKLEMYEHMGLERKKRVGGTEERTGKFLLEDRVVFPVRSVTGKIFAFIGWYPDVKKYITTPSALFSKNSLFYGMEQLGSSGSRPNLLLVEGIFDSLALRSVGVENTIVLATMGSNVQGLKRELYRLFNRIIAIPDRDSTGRKVVKNDGWSLPTGASYLRLKVGRELDGVKDIDDVVRLVGSEGMKDYFDSLMSLTTLPRYLNLEL